MGSIRSTSGRSTVRSAVVGRIAMVLVCVGLSSVSAQMVGEEAELARLRAKAEDAMANDDPDGAAMNMGRAALMAAHLAKKQEGFGRLLYNGTESLLRSQEHAYRAMALFRRAGNQLPASSGVCGSLDLARGSLTRAAGAVTELSTPAPSPRLGDEARQLKESTDTWHTAIEAISTDYQCR